MPKPLDLEGMKFGKLTALSSEKGSRSNPKKWLCLCDCGKMTSVLTNDLISGHTTSCGCKRAETLRATMGKTYMYRDTPLYSTWKGMKERCNNPNAHNYQWYGARGIRVCDEWESENGFLNFRKWALENGYEKGLDLDRKDNDGVYSPDNCRWITHKENMQNTRHVRRFNVKGRQMTISQIADAVGCKRWKIEEMVRNGKTDEIEQLFRSTGTTFGK